MTLKNLSTLILLVIFCSTLSACSSADNKKAKHYQRALEYIKMSDDKAAILELKNAVQLDAKFADARYQLALLYLKAGDPRAAFAELQRTASLDPNNLDAGTKVAEFHLLSHNMVESRKYVDQVLAVNPNYKDALALLANLDLIEKKIPQAHEAIDKAIQQDANNDVLYNIKARIFVAENKWAESEQLFKKAIELKPDHFPNYRNLLMFYDQRKDEQALQTLLTTMLQKFPENPQLQLMLAGLYQKKGDLQKTEQALLQTIALQKDDSSFRLMLADFYKNHQMFDKAQEVLKSAITDFPKEIQLQVSLAELQFDLQKFPEAKTMMDTILASNPANGGANLLKARFLIRDGKNDEALQIITPLTNDYPKWPDPFYYSALTNLRIGKIELAQKSIDQAIQINPANDRYHALAAEIHLVQGNGADAEKEAGIALNINSRNFIAMKILVQSMVQQKSYAKAIKIIESLDKKLLAGDADLLGAAGMAYLGLKNVEKAKENISALLTLAPDNSKALSLLTALTTGKDIDKAIAFVKKHIAAHPSGGHYLLLGELYVNKKLYNEALQAFEKAQELRPEDPQGYILRAGLLKMMGKTDETIAQYNELLASHPNSIAALMGLATTFESVNRLADAKAKYLRVLELQPNLPAAANNLAWIIASEDNGDLGEALRLAMQAKQALPDQPNISDTLGWVHYKRKSYSLAISQFVQALERRPEDPSIRYHLALAQYANGEKGEAISLLEKVLAGEGRFKERDEAKATLESWKK